LTDIQSKDFTIEGVDFFDVKIVKNFAWDILDMVKWNTQFVHPDTKKVSLSCENNLYDMLWNYYVIEYSCRMLATENIASLEKNFCIDGWWHFSCIIEHNGIIWHVPEYKGRFSYNGKNYIIVGAVNTLTSETDFEKGIYKWVIIEPDSYFFQIEETLSGHKNTIQNILAA
jgi:hypothetical protein